MITKERYDMPLRIKSVGDKGEFAGYGSVFGVEDSYGDVVVRGAFQASLDAWAAKGRYPALLWQHNDAEPIGVYTRMVEDDQGLYVEGRLLVEDDPLARRAHGHLQAGSLSGLSIGYTLEKDGWEYDQSKDVFLLKKINLWEVSLVTFPANDDARVQTVKSALRTGKTPDVRMLEGHLRDVGFSRQQAKAFLADGLKGLTCRDDARASKAAADSAAELKTALAGWRW